MIARYGHALKTVSSHTQYSGFSRSAAHAFRRSTPPFGDFSPQTASRNSLPGPLPVGRRVSSDFVGRVTSISIVGPRPPSARKQIP